MTTARSRRGLGRALALSATALLALPIGAASASSTALGSNPLSYRSVGSIAKLPFGDRVLGRLPSARTVRADVVLRPTSAGQLTQYATAVSSPRSGLYRHYISSAAFRATFAPASAVRERVEAQLRRAGLEVEPVTADGLVIPVEASASRMEAAFHTTLESVRLQNGRLGQWATSAPKLPANIAGSVFAVLGLDQLVVPEPLTAAPPAGAPSRGAAGAGQAHHAAASLAPIKGAPTACAAATNAAVTLNSFTDDQEAHSYGMDGLYSKGILGAGQTVALFEEDVYATSDLRRFDECYLGADHTKQVSQVNIDGGEPGGFGGGEATLDVEDVSAYAPGAHIDVYDAPGTLIGWVDEMAAIVNQDKASVVNVSYGLCETQMEEAAPGLIQTENILFEEAALQGQTFVVASGDSGSETCYRNDPSDTSLSVSDPASQPFATSVGGTSLKVASVPPVETVWNDGGSGAVGSFGENGAGGGGISQVWPMPSWQASSTVRGVFNHYSNGAACDAPSGTDCREVPDVTASADELHGDTIVYGGSWGTIGGTSAAAPKWVALLALTNDYCATLGKSPVGFVTPALYQIASNPISYAEAFNDITKGTNDVLGSHDGAYPAIVGFDLASGFGSPRVAGTNGSPGLASLLCSDGSSDASHPTITGISPEVGSYTGGTTVTLTGTHLAGVTRAQFGPASVAVRSSDINAGGTEITVKTPPSPVQPFNGGTPVGGVLVGVTGPHGTSEPTSSAEFHYLAGSDSSPDPSVDYLTPTSAVAGTKVTIFGSGFKEGVSTPTVEFGGVNATGVTVVSDSELTVKVPAQTGSTDCVTESQGVPLSSLCQVEVTVTNSFGTSATQTILPPPTGLVIGLFIPTPGTENVPAVTEFDYSPTPVISSVSPDTVGLTPFEFGVDPFTPPILTITGTGFNYFSLEQVDAKVASDPSLDQSLFVGIITPTTVEFDAPVFVPGFVIPAASRAPASLPTSFALSVVSAHVRSNIVNVAVAPATITVSSLSRHDGSTAGGGTVTVTGTHLGATAGIYYQGGPPLFGFGSTTDFTVVSPTKITFVTPALVAGTGYFEVCDASVCAGSPPATSFDYFDPVKPVATGISPTSGSVGGGETVTITGTGLGSVTAVRFGSAVTTEVINPPTALGSSTTSVLAVAPPGRVGEKVAVTVITLAGRSRPAPVKFTYTKGAPGPATHVTARAAPGMGVVKWSPPRNDGGSPVLGYSVSAHVPSNPYGPPVTTYSPSVNLPASARSVDLPVTPYLPWVFAVRVHTARGSRTVSINSPVLVGLGDDGYALAASDGTVIGYGDLGGLPPGFGGTRKASPIVGIAVSPSASGDWILAADGKVTASGNVRSHGSLAPSRHHASPVDIVADATGGGYWIVTANGGVFAYGVAKRHGSISRHLTSPIVSAASTFDGGGYWLANSAGDVFAFGNAKYSGSLAGRHFKGKVVSIMSDGFEGGYWLVTSAGRVYEFGGAAKITGVSSVPSPVVSAAPAPDGRGCWLLESNGTVLALGHALFEGDPVGGLESKAVALSA